MKVLQVISGMGLKSGGPTTCTYNLIQGLQSRLEVVDLLTFDATEGDQIISRASFMKILTPPKKPRYGYSKELKIWLVENQDYDLYHTNALWQYSSHAAAVAAKKQNKPYVISPHGMLYPEGLKKSKWFKKMALILFQKQDLINATALHATSEKELGYIRTFGLTQPIALIPNAIDVNSIRKYDIDLIPKKVKIGFLGRLVPIKNLEILIEAWAQAKKVTQNAELVIIGDGDDQYIQELKVLIKKYNITNISFLGFLSGIDQENVMQQLSYLVLPSKSENFGMVVPEALARKIPVIASKGTPWEELNTYQCGWWVDNDLKSMASALETALSLDESERLKMGEIGRALVEKRYSIQAVSDMMFEFYTWLLSDSGKAPSFVNIKS
jgi:glycosyltransferase involved in cell wall biosynthesis